MRQEARQMDLAGEALASIRQQVLSASMSAPSYEGQFGPNVRAVMADLLAAIDKLIAKIASCTEYVRLKADAFDEADHLAIEGWDGVAERYRAWLDAEHLPFDLIARLHDGRPPEGIPEEVWRHLSPEDKAALLLGKDQQLDETIQAYQEPPWVQDEGWLWDFLGLGHSRAHHENLPPEDWAVLQEYVEGKRHEFEDMWPQFVAAVVAGTSYLPPADKAGYFKDMFGAYVNGVPEKGSIAKASVLAGTYGEGADAWNDFRSRENAPAQYLDPRLLVGSGPTEHWNLCGELAVLAAVGETDVAEGLRRFSEVTTWQADRDLEGNITREYHSGSDILANPLEATTLPTLDRFFGQYGWEAEVRTGQLNVNQLAGMLQEGRAVVALVNIDTSQDGRLMGVNSSQEDTPHFVTVLQVAQTQNGDAFVRVYNPFQNQEEFYRWETFDSAWSETPGNRTQYGLVVADAP